MTTETTTKFVSSVGGSMLSYKRYPSSDDYYNVAQSITMKYPHLKSPTGSPNVCFKLLASIHSDYCIYREQLFVCYRTVSRNFDEENFEEKGLVLK